MGVTPLALLALLLGAPAPATPRAPAPKRAAPAKAAPAPSAPPASRSLAAQPAAGADLSKCLSCHAPMFADATGHPPAQQGDCSVCHLPAGAAAGRCQSPASTAWKLKAEQPRLCSGCHDVSGAAPLHPIIKSAGCTACHDPHASKNKAFAKAATVEALCAKCHPGVVDAKFPHTAAKKGDCLACHSPHAGEARPLLVDVRTNLCGGCHKQDALAAQHSRHAPAAEGRCLECHDPHGTDNPAALVEAGRKLCLKCHDAANPPKQGAPAERFRVQLAAKTVHKPFGSDDCTVCHTPKHGSDQPHLLQKTVAETCFKCHPKFDELYKFQHGAARLGRCEGCHDPHASANKSLLRDADPKGLCFRCHQDDVTMRRWVHAPVNQGCNSCHDPHGGDFRNSFTAGEGKALCLSCHKPKEFERKRKHVAVERYGCTACHDPHASNQPNGLVKPVNALCLSCHPAQKDGRHVVSMGHKVEGGPDPHDLKKDFTCASCHDPHGGPGKGMFYLDADGMGMCAWCHGDKSGKRPELKDISRARRPGPEPKTAAEVPAPAPVAAPVAAPAPAAAPPPPPKDPAAAARLPR